MRNRLQITALLLLLLPAGVFASPQDDLIRLDAEIGGLKEKLAAQQRVSGSLQERIDALRTKIALTETELEKTRSQLAALDSQIASLSTKIAETEAEITQKKELVRSLIRFDYIQSHTTTAEILLGSGSLSEAYARTAYAQSVRTKLEETVSRLAGLKAQLAADRSRVGESRGRAAALEATQTAQEQGLASQKAEQSRLLAHSRSLEQGLVAQIQRRAGEAEAIKQAIRRIGNSPTEKQKQQQAVVPPSGQQGAAVPLYLQIDGRWAGQGMNGTSSTIGDYGCGIASIAMVLSYYGYTTTPAQIAADSRYFYGSTDLIQWSGTDRGINAATGGRFDWGRVTVGQVSAYASEATPVLVWIESAFGPNTRHFVVITGVASDGGWVMNDPVRGGSLRFDAFYGSALGKPVIQVDLITPA